METQESTSNSQHANNADIRNSQPSTISTTKNTHFQNTACDNYQQDMLDPYLFQPSDNPSVAIIKPHLNNFNYHSWSHLVTVTIRSNNKLGFLDGTLARPTDIY